MASSLQVMQKRLVLLNPRFANQGKRNITAPTNVESGEGQPPIVNDEEVAENAE